MLPQFLFLCASTHIDRDGSCSASLPLANSTLWLSLCLPISKILTFYTLPSGGKYMTSMKRTCSSMFNLVFRRRDRYAEVSNTSAEKLHCSRSEILPMRPAIPEPRCIMDHELLLLQYEEMLIASILMATEQLSEKSCPSLIADHMRMQNRQEKLHCILLNTRNTLQHA